MGIPAAVALGLVGLLAVGVLAACELVLAHTTRARASTMADEGVDRADELLGLLTRRQTNLSVLVVVRLAVQVGLVALVLWQVEAADAEAWVPPAALAATVVVLVTVEAVAKTLALVRTDRVARRVVPVARLVAGLPVLSLVGEVLGRRIRGGNGGVDDDETRPKVSEEELLAFAEVAVEAEAIEEEEQALIASIIEFGDTIVREVMVPRPDMITVEATWAVSDVVEVVILNGYSRIPVLGDGIDDVVGIAYAKDLMRAERDGQGGEPVGQHLRSARFVPEQQRVSVLLPEMQAEQFHMAVVVDEYGGVAGLVTLEDLIEELVGEIVDEFDVEDPMAEPLPGGGYRVNARMPLDEVNDLLGADLPEGDWDTVGGLLFGSLGHVPTNGEAIEIGSLRLTAARVQGRRIGLVRIDRLPPADPDGEGRTGAATTQATER